MKFCSNCVMPDTKPGVTLDENGWCNACRNSLIKQEVDWNERWEQLVEIAENIKKKNNPFYDCVVPVSGGKDSWYQAMVMSEKLGLKVLCVTLCPHLPTSEGIGNLNTMVADLNVDIIKITLKQSTFRAIRRKCFLRRGEPNWAEHCAVFSSVVRTALLYEVPLVVWGEDIAFEFGGAQRENSKPSAIEIDKSDLIAGNSIHDWLDDDLSERDIYFYEYPDYKDLDETGVSSIYLGHFMPWYGRKHYEIVKKRGFKCRTEGPLSGNYLDYDNIDEKLCEINIWFKYLKFGFWRATDQCCYDIWNGKMDRDEAVKIVNKIQNEFPKEHFEDFLRFHNLTKAEFNATVDRFRNKGIWHDFDGKWDLIYKLT